MINEKKIFVGGINDDDEWNLIPEGDYIALENGTVNVSEEGKNLRIENIKGNDLVGKITRSTLTVTTFNLVGNTPLTPGNYGTLVFGGTFVNGDIINDLRIVRQLGGGGSMSIFFGAIGFVPGDTSASYFARIISVINTNVECVLYGISAFALPGGNGIQINTAFGGNTDFITVSATITHTQVDSILPNGVNITHGSCVDLKNKRILYANWNSLGEHGIYCYDTILDKIYTVVLSSNLNISRIACSPTFLGGGANYGTSAQYVYSGVGIVGDELQISFQRFGGGPSFGVSVRIRYAETLAQALVRLAVLFNTNPVAIAENLTATANGTILHFGFNSIQWLGGNIVTLEPFVPSNLVFEKYNRIDRNMKVIGDLLYLVDNYNQPFKINIERGIKTNNGGYITAERAYILPLDITQLTWIKKPPIEVLVTTKFYDSSKKNNFIEKESYLFTYRYKYSDNEYSALATYTPMIYPNVFNIKTGNLFGANENWNGILIALPLTEKIIDDVSRVEFYAKYGNVGKTILIKSFDKKNIPQSQSILDHNSGTTAISFSWYGDTGAVALGDVESVKDFHSIPRKAKTFDIAKNKNFVGNFLSGYNTPKTTSLTKTLFSQTIPLSGAYKSFKFNSKFSLGISFYDQFKRKCGIVTNETLMVQVPEQTNTIPLTYNYALQWNLSNTNAALEIPDWAYYYSVDTTDNLVHQDFVSWRAAGADSSVMGVRYVSKKNSTGYVYVDGTYNNNFYGLALCLDDLNANGGGYNFREGDICDLTIVDAFLSNVVFFKSKVLGLDGNYIIINLLNVGDSTSASSGVLTFTFCISTLRQYDVNEQYYTKGVLHKILAPATSGRTYATLSGTMEGDVYAVSILSRTGIIEVKNKNMLVFNRWDKNLGFINIEDEIGEQRLETAVAYTNTYIQGSKVNGLNEIEPLSRKEIGGEGGAINKLQLANKKQEDGKVILAICANQTSSIYLGELQLKNANETSNLIISDGVIGSINALKLNLGTTNPESVIEKDGEVYWVDLENECLVQYSPNGLFPISDFKLKKFLRLFSKAYKTLGVTALETLNGFSHLSTGIDPFRNEVLFTTIATKNNIDIANFVSYSLPESYTHDVKNKTNLYEGAGKTLGFNPVKNKFGNTYSFVAEWTEYLDNSFYTFKSGKIYKHGINANYNTFYGVAYPTRVMFGLNTAPSAIKDILNINIEGNKRPMFTLLYTNYPDVQITDIAGTDVDIHGTPAWINNEGRWISSFLRDRLSPNVSGTAFQKMLDGDFIKTANPFIMLEFPEYNSLLFINYVNVGFELSRSHLKIVK